MYLVQLFLVAAIFTFAFYILINNHLSGTKNSDGLAEA
jgi:hypothetical protein